MKKELIEEIKRIHTLTYGDNKVNEQLGSIKDLMTKFLFGSDSETETQSKTKTQTPSSVVNKSSGIKITDKGSQLLSNPAFSKKLDEVSKNLGINKDWLITIMTKESGIDPSKTNPIGCVGLIQFCPDAPRGTTKKIGGKVIDLNKLKTLSAIDQLDLIEDYYEPYKSRIRSKHDLYLVTFYPSALGKHDSYVIGGQTKYGLKISKQNPAIARSAGKTPGKHYLTVGDIKQFVA